MRPKILLPLLVVLCGGLASAQPAWYEAYSQQTGLILSICLTDSTPTLYSPLQSASPIAAKKHTWRGDTLRFDCTSIGFKATMNFADSSLYWRQGVLRETVTFHRADSLFVLQRPQTPSEPYAFVQREVEADYVDPHGDSVHLAGTLALPRGEGPFPALLLVNGSGQQNRDSEIMRHRPFLVLADYLAQHGIATLRYDDRGVGGSTGPTEGLTTLLSAADAEQMFQQLLATAEVDGHRAGILGHSEGGLIACIVAARRADVSCLVMLAGQGVSGREVMLSQNRALFEVQGISPQLVSTRLRCLDSLFSLPDTASLSTYQSVIQTYTGTLSPAQQDSIALSRRQAYALRQQLSSPWMQTFLRLDPSEYLPRTSCPILALNGDLDLQVLAADNLPRIQQLAGSRATTRLLPGLNHLFQQAQTGLPSEYVFIAQTIDLAVLALVADFVLAIGK